MIERTEQDIKKNWVTNGDPLVSICCPTFNHEKFIGKAIESFLIQETTFPFEIIVRDDCSTDNSAAIVESYAQRYPRIIKPIYESENQYCKGISPLPVILKHAKGEYLAFCEGDDYWINTQKLQKQVEFLMQHKDYSMCYHSRIFVDENDTEICKKDQDPCCDYEVLELIAGVAIPMTVTIVARNVLDDSINVPKVFGGDVLLLHLLGFHGSGKFLASIGKGAAYRIHSDGVWSNLSTFERVDPWLETRKHIRKSIMENVPNNSEILQRHDLDYLVFFNTVLLRLILQHEVRKYFSILLKISKQKELCRKEIYQFHFVSLAKKMKKYVQKILVR